MSDAVSFMREIATRKEIDLAAEQWIVRAFSAWWQDGKDPNRLAMFLQLGGPSRSAIAERNHWLLIAASELPQERRAADLQRRVGEFMKSTWPMWRRSTQPPVDAEPFLAALFFAADSGATMQLGERQWRNIARKSLPV